MTCNWSACPHCGAEKHTDSPRSQAGPASCGPDSAAPRDKMPQLNMPENSAQLGTQWALREFPANFPEHGRIHPSSASTSTLAEGKESLTPHPMWEWGPAPLPPSLA